jgi:hypothetical protein
MVQCDMMDKVVRTGVDAFGARMSRRSAVMPTSGRRIAFWGAGSGPWPELRSPEAIAVYCLAIIGAYVATFLVQWFVPEITDISWIFVICEKMLAGEHLYTDIMETNPPMTVLLYMPTVLLSHLVSISPEFLEILLVAALVSAVVTWTSRILVASGQIESVARFRVIATLGFALLPLGCFSEREHIALLVTLPAIAITAARIDGYRIDWRIAVIAGLGEGLAATIKPQLALPVLLMVAWGVVQMRSLRLPLQLEHWIGATIAALYLAVVYLCFPEYLSRMMPLLLETYRPVRYPLAEIAGSNGAIVYYCMVAALIVIGGRSVLRPRLMMPLLASLGYFGSYIEQSKGWPYHLYPAIGLIAVTLLNEVITRASHADIVRLKGRVWLTLQLGTVVAFIASIGIQADYLEERQWDSFPLVAKMRKLAAHPTIAIMSDDLGLTNPLVRMVNGTFVGTLASQWITNYANFRMDHEDLDVAGMERMRSWIEYDRAVLANDIRRTHPDFIIVDRGGPDYLAWAQQSPDLAALIRDYRQAGRANDIYLLARSDLAPNDPHPSSSRFWRLGGSDRWDGLNGRDEQSLRIVRAATR